MKVIKYKYNPNKKGVFRVSIVKNPAVGEGDLVLMASQEIKGVFYSPVMIPYLKIQRVNPETGETYMAYYDAETVEQLANNYFKQNGNAKTNLEHQDNDTDGVYPVESWIVQDPENDKSKALGMHLQKKGTWIMGYKAENEEVLEQVKNKLLQGLSIEGHLDTVEDTDSPISKFNKENNMFDKVKEGLNSLLTLMSYEGEKDPEKMEVLEDDQEKKEEDVVMEEEMVEPEVSDMEKEMATLKATNEELEKKNADLEAKLATYENEATLMSSQLEQVNKAFESYKSVKMSSQSIGDYKTEKKDFSKMTPLERFRATK